MLFRGLWLAGLLLAAGGNGQSSSTESESGSLVLVTGSQSVSTSTNPAETYASIGSQVTATNRYATSSASSTSSGSSTASSTGTHTGTGTATTTGTESSSKSSSTTEKPGTTSVATLLVGGGGVVVESIINGTVTLSSHANTTTSSGTGTGTSTSSSAAATNTQPCNSYPEFCSRKYSNITQVCAHNSAFVKADNAAANQHYGVTQQLNDGIRMIQGETHYVNGSIYSCHTSCDLLNAGTLESELTEVYEWVKDHPYDVVTILLVNSDYVNVGNYTAPLQNSGLGPYLYEPPYIPMRLGDWPTLSEMILSQKRVVVFMDYQANQQKVPYILDEFTQMWETPFSPEDVNFPCTTQRPPNLNQTLARDDLMYIANHNLNQEFSLFGESLLLPNTASINITNAAGNQTQMLGAMAGNCTEDWGRPPNFLLVDYYDIGNGSVFEVAAKYNNVTYTGTCCGITTSGADGVKSSALALVVALAAVFVFIV